MKKILIRGLALVLLFFATWFLLNQLDWISIFKVQKITDRTEAKLGSLIWETINRSEDEVTNPEIVQAVDSIVNSICKANAIDREFLKLHILHKDDINAFALPNGHLVIYSGLILAADNPEELSGVIGHEMAHIQLNHVMKKLVRELGLATLISVTTGNTGGDVIKEAVKLLSSSAFDRSHEKEADLKAVDYLANAHINPKPFADFLYKLSDKDMGPYLSWISTHPESKERAEYIIEYNKQNLAAETYTPALSTETWKTLNENLTNTTKP